jgi:hypothetical protein
MLQIAYLNGVVMPDESSEEDEDEVDEDENGGSVEADN